MSLAEPNICVVGKAHMCVLGQPMVGIIPLSHGSPQNLKWDQEISSLSARCPYHRFPLVQSGKTASPDASVRSQLWFLQQKPSPPRSPRALLKAASWAHALLFLPHVAHCNRLLILFYSHKSIFFFLTRLTSKCFGLVTSENLLQT